MTGPTPYAPRAALAGEAQTAAGAGGASGLRVDRVAPGGTLPVYRAPAGVDSAAWAAPRREAIEAALLSDGALLLRGFGVRTAHEFVRVAEVLANAIESGYSELPADPSGERCYRATPYPPSFPILFHNESAHRRCWPVRQLFCCIEAASEGGATLLADGHSVADRLDPAIVELLRRRGLLYVRNFSADFDLDWPAYFGTASRAEAEVACVRAGAEFEWTRRGLRTWQRRPALVAHPRTGVELLFHQILLHHPCLLPADVRRALEAEYAEDSMPRNVLFGDGDPIEDAVVAEIRLAYEAAAIRVRWEPGDVLVFDNVRIAHAREAFAGPRTVLVALGDFASAPEFEA